MRIVVIAVILLSLASCGRKETWTKEALVNKCLKSFNEKNEKEKIFSSLQIGQLCDCVAEKMKNNYKSGADADKDEEGAKKIGQDCATEVMSK